MDRGRHLCLPSLVLIAVGSGCSSSASPPSAYWDASSASDAGPNVSLDAGTNVSLDAGTDFRADAAPSLDGAPHAPDGSSPVDAGDAGVKAMDADTSVDGSAPPDAAGTMDASPGYDGGPLMCTAPAAFNMNNGGSCGSYRWSVKVGTDSAAGNVSLTPTETTIAALGQLPVPPGLGTNLPRTAQENTLYILRNVTVLETKLEPDSDYHMPIKDPATNATMEAEIPFPPCGSMTSPFYCGDTHARASLERIITPTGSYQPVNQVATIIGTAFFDTLHGSANAAPNGIEIHPVIALCFGMDCDPTAN